MVKIIFAILALVVIVILGTIGSRFLSEQLRPFSLYPQETTQQATVTILNQTFTVSIARTEEEKQIGLFEETTLAQTYGMLFVYETPGDYGFWMKNMKIPIDIIFIRQGRIVTIYQNVAPSASTNETQLIYKPEEPADMVLEIQSGLSQKYGFQKGDTLEIKGL